MQCRELTEALDEGFPAVAVADRRSQPGRLAGGVAGPEHTPAGVLLAEFTDDEERRDAHPLPWQDNQTYFLRRPPEAPEVWTRVLPRHPVSDDVEAIVLTAAADPDAGVRRWSVLG
jgi:hypothetical protein